MKFRSVCSGIEAASVAWIPLGWECVEVAEIDPFPCAVLEHRYPEVPNAGDFTAIRTRPKRQVATADILVGGTPCQSFSLAGLRGGLGDARGQLTLEFLRLAAFTRPPWVVWENVPGVLSSDGGRDFGAFLGGLVELGYGFAYRVMDAQHIGVPQQRRRVFVVGHLGDWRRAAAVLFERHSLSGDPPPGREAGAIVTSALTRSLGSGGPDAARGQANHLIPDTAFCLNAGGMRRGEPQSETLIAHTLRGEGFDASEDGTGRGKPLIACTLVGSDGGVSSGYHPIIPIQNATRGKDQNGLGVGDPGSPMYTLDQGSQHGVVIPFDTTQITSPGNYSRPQPGNPCHPLAARAHPPAIAFHATQDPISGDGSPCLPTSKGSIGDAARSAVRRLTPRECERLQGFPDDWTLVPYRGRWAADGPRYKAIGNSMAVPVMRWIGRRIQMVHQMEISS